MTDSAEPAKREKAIVALVLQPVALDAQGVALLLGFSRSFVRKLDRSARLPRPVRIGRRCVWSREEIERWFAAGAPCRVTWETLRKEFDRAS